MKKMDYQNVRGTQDYLPEHEVTRRTLKDTLMAVSRLRHLYLIFNLNVKACSHSFGYMLLFLFHKKENSTCIFVSKCIYCI